MDWDRIEDLFEQALELPPAQREDFIQSDSVASEEREHLLRLVQADELATGFLTQSPNKFRNAAKLAPGKLIGDWRIVEPIGAGGMGDVYKVLRDTGDFEQFGALKLLHHVDPTAQEKFAQERMIAAQLSHESIARLIDGNATSDGHQYMVMDLVPGRSLTDYAQANRLNQRQRLKLFCELCAAVGYAHSKLILHRDIKPTNILVSNDGRLKLVDFGVAAFLSDASGGESAPLTIAYAAPEQLAGDSVSTATDIYALGIVLCELLTGERRTHRDSALSNDLQAIIDKCTEIAPSDRYQSTEGLKTDIERFLGDLPVSARRGGYAYRLKKFFSRYRVTTAVTAMALIGLSGALWITVSAYERSEKALQQAFDTAEQWEFEARTTRGLRRAILQLYGVESEAGDPISSDTIDERLLEISRQAEVAATQGDVQQAHDMFAIGGHFMRRFEHDKAIDVYERLLASGAADPLLDVATKSSLAWSLEYVGREEEALALAKEVVANRQPEANKYDQPVIEVERIIASADGSPEARDALIDRIQHAIEDEKELPIHDRFYTHWYYNQMGVLYLRAGDYESAARSFVEEFYHGRDLGVRSLEMVSTSTNAAQGQVYVLREGAAPLAYIDDYLPYVNGEIGDDDLRHGFMRSIQADAALLVGDWERAHTDASDAIELLGLDPNHRGGWVHQARLTRLRAALKLERIDTAEADMAYLQTALSTSAEGASLPCVTALGQAAMVNYAQSRGAARVALDEALVICSGDSARPLRAPFKFHADTIGSL